MRLFAFGEILWDIFLQERHIGGASLNFAAHFSLHGGESFMLSSLGDDELGRDALATLSHYKINSDYVSILKLKRTGESIITLNDNGIPSYRITEDTAYDYINCDSVSINEDDLLYFGTLALRGDYNRKSLLKLLSENKFREIFADVNLRAPFIYPETMKIALEHATIIKISDEELPTLTKEILGHELSYATAAKEIANQYKNLKIIIITLGNAGAYIYDAQSNAEFSAPAVKVKVLSTVGAGDSFSAAFLYSYINGKNIQKSLEYATRVSAFVVSREEAVPNYDPKNIII